MNVNLVCKVGFKILAAVVAGAAIVIGIDKAVGGDKKCTKPQGPDPKMFGGNYKSEGNQVPTSSSEVGRGLQQASQQNCNQTTTDVILSGIRGAGETCSKLFTLAQALSQMIQSVGSVFGNYRAPSGYGGYPGQQGQTVRSGNIVWVPATNSSCILQAVPAENNNNGW